MSKRNATASWSGYSHQGQVGILIALRALQNLADLHAHFVQFETHEDVALYHLAGSTKTYLSVHQVKAYYSAANIYKSTYSDVLSGPFESGNERFLHTAVEIQDWITNTTTVNTNNVKLYPYTTSQNYCGTTEIEHFIKNELTTILSPASDSVINNAYHRLSFELDNRIRREHQRASKDLFDIKFSLNEVNDLIRCTDTFDSKEIYDCRKLFYDIYIEFVKNENLTPERITALEDNIIKHLNALDDTDFRLLLQRMNLNESLERLKQSQIYLNKPGLTQVFFRALIDIVGTDALLQENSVVIYDKLGESSKYILTAIIDEERDKLTVIENILSNLVSQNLLWESHSLVNRHIDVDLIYRNPAINSIATLTENEDDKNKFMSYANSKLVVRETAISKLNNE